MLKKLSSYILPVLAVLPLLSPFVETVIASEENVENVEMVQPLSPRVYKTVTRLYPSAENVPQTIFHREFINNYRYEGTLTLVSLIKDSSGTDTGTYTGTYKGYIYKTPILGN